MAQQNEADPRYQILGQMRSIIDENVRLGEEVKNLKVYFFNFYDIMTHFLR